MEITTTRPGGGLSTQTTGPTALPTVAQAQPNLTSMTTIADYLAKKRQAQQPQQPMMPRIQQPEQPEYVPKLGTMQSAPEYMNDPNKQKYLTRQVDDWDQSNYSNFAPGTNASTNIPGMPRKTRTERYIDGKWEFDNVDPRRQGGGGGGRIDTASAPMPERESFASFKTRSQGAGGSGFASGSGKGA